ncbi:MAG TPA: hypothetical protein VFO44_15120 [Steroidobacteraceae bacterium]|nr:hypothetical protein [Steroidobacteraceae bacterium]
MSPADLVRRLRATADPLYVVAAEALAASRAENERLQERGRLLPPILSMRFFATVALVLAVFLPGFRTLVLICLGIATLVIACAIATNGMR